MGYTVETLERKFSPKEAAEISGVSTSLQRDWRRRGFLTSDNPDGWASFSAEDIIRMTVMRSLSRSGLSLDAAETVSSMSVLPVLATLSRWASFVGDPIPSEEQEEIQSNAIAGVSEEEQFSFVALPEQDGGVSAARLKDLKDGEMIMGKSKSFLGLVVDHYGLAHQISDKAEGAIITYKVTAR